MLKRFKQATLRSLKTSGVSTLVQNSRWRRQRLLILAYHGISTDDQHRWNGSMYMSPEMFRARLATIARTGCAVLPLAEAITRLYANDLPDRSVAITFDDGNFDFKERAFPVLKEFGFPSLRSAPASGAGSPASRCRFSARPSSLAPRSRSSPRSETSSSRSSSTRSTPVPSRSRFSPACGCRRSEPPPPTACSSPSCPGPSS